jgi:hypothetical protein
MLDIKLTNQRAGDDLMLWSSQAACTETTEKIVDIA